MDMFREGETSMASKMFEVEAVEESAEVRNTLWFQSDTLLLYAFSLVCESLPSHSIYKKGRDFQTFLSSINITHPFIIQNELVLWLTHFLAFVWAPNRAAMKRSRNRCQNFHPHESFSSLRKPDFPNMALQCFWLISLVIFFNASNFFRPAPSRFPPLLSM